MDTVVIVLAVTLIIEGCVLFIASRLGLFKKLTPVQRYALSFNLRNLTIFIFLFEALMIIAEKYLQIK